MSMISLWKRVANGLRIIWEFYWFTKWFVKFYNIAIITFWLYRKIWIYMGIPILIQSLVNLDFDLALVSGSPSSSLSRVAFSCCGNLGFAGTSLDLGAPNFLRRTRTLTHEPTRFWSDLAFNFPAPGTKFCSTVPANAIPSVHQCPANSEFEALAAQMRALCMFSEMPRRAWRQTGAYGGEFMWIACPFFESSGCSTFPTLALPSTWRWLWGCAFSHHSKIVKIQ